MTKRMLSLLLALVMTLSLCVPALAADEFAAEVVTEVEEQAPEAPVEPEAPEADEPVVDEPVIEEADAPEIAAVMEELTEEMEDDPMAIAVGDIQEKWQLRLQKALDLAAPYKTRVEAGELFVRTGETTADTSEWKDFDYETNDPAKSFKDAYAEVERNLKGIGGIETGGDVTETSAQTAIITLMRMLPKATGAAWGSNLDYKMGTIGGTNTAKKWLSDKPTTAMITAVTAANSSTSAGLAHSIYPANNVTPEYTYGKTPTSGPNLSLTDSNTTYASITKKLSSGDWTLAYRSNYVDALKAAVAAAETFSTSDKKYADFDKVAKAIQAAYELEKDAGKPTSSEATELQNAIDETTAKIEDKKFNANEWVYGSTFVTGDALYKAADGSGAVPDAIEQIETDGLLTPGLTPNGFKATAKYYDFRKALKTVKIGEDLKQAKTNSVKEVDVDFTKNSDDEITAVTFKVNIDKADNPYTYFYAYKVNGHWADNDHLSDGSGWAGKWSDDPMYSDIGATTTFSASQSDGTYSTATAFNLRPLREVKDKEQNKYTFKTTDTVEVYFYVNYLGRTDKNTTAVYNWTVKFPSDNYTGPGVKKDADGKDMVTYTFGNPTGLTDSDSSANKLLGLKAKTLSDTTKVKMEVTLSKGFDGQYKNDKLTADSDVYLVLLDTSRKEVAVEPIKATDRDSNKTTLSLELTAEEEDKLTASGMTLELRVATKSGESAVAHDNANCKVPVTFEALTKWDGLSEVKEVIADAKVYSKSDVKLASSTSPADIELDDAWTLFANAITTLEADVNGASSKINTINNRAKVLKDLGILFDTSKNLDLVTLDYEDLNNSIAKAEALLVDEDEYSASSWVNFEDALWAAQAAKTDATLQSVLDAATKALEDAIKALTGAAEVDKAGLNASIAAAKALKEEDYTPESWAANKAAIDNLVTAAETVAANADATQAQVDAAKKALDEAMAKLEKVVPDIQPPAGGNGWRYVPETGDYYFFKDGKMCTSYWAGQTNGGSKWNFWYYLGPDGKMWTGFHYIVDDNGTGWFMLQTDNTNGTIGSMKDGWQNTGVAGSGWFTTTRGANYGQCTYTSAWGDYNPATGLWADGQGHR